MDDNRLIRGVSSLFGSLCVCAISFVVFNVLYIEWAVWRYPHNDSMAGFAAFIYGIPVAIGSGILAWFRIQKLLRSRYP